MLTAYPIFQPVACVEADPQAHNIAFPSIESGQARLFGRFKVFAAIEPDYAADLKRLGALGPSRRSSASSLNVDSGAPPLITFSGDDRSDMASVAQRPPSLTSINNERFSLATESSEGLLKTLPTTTATAMLEVPHTGLSTSPLRKVLSAPNLLNRFPASVFEVERIKPRLGSFASYVETGTNKRPIPDSDDSSAAPSRTASPAPPSLLQQSITEAVASRLRGNASLGVSIPHTVSSSAIASGSDQQPSNLLSSPSLSALPQQNQLYYPQTKSQGRGWFSFLNYPSTTQPILRHDEPSLSKDLDKLAASQIPRHNNSSRNLQVIREDPGPDFTEPTFAHQRSDVTDVQRWPNGAVADSSLLAAAARIDGERSVTPTQQHDVSSTTSLHRASSSRAAPVKGVAGFLTHLTNRLGVTPSESNTFAPSDL